MVLVREYDRDNIAIIAKHVKRKIAVNTMTIKPFDKLNKYASIGMRIQTIRSAKGMSQTKFAANIGISQRFLSDLESGKIKPSKPILLAIEYVYKYRKEWILTGDEPAFIYTPGAGPMVITPPDQQEITDRQTIYWSKFVARILKEGNKTKIETLKNLLKTFDPAGERDEQYISDKGQKKA